MYLLRKISNLGVANGMPRYFSAFALVPVIVLFTPEQLLASAIQFRTWLPDFTTYSVDRTDFPWVMTAFWIVGPLVMLINSVLFVRQLNTVGYSSYLARRAENLRNAGASNRLGLLLGIVAGIALYIWSTCFYQNEPRIPGAVALPNSRFAMVMLHAGALGLLFPGFLAALITEFRVLLTTSRQTAE